MRGHGHGHGFGHGHGRKETTDIVVEPQGTPVEKGYIVVAVIYLLGLFIGALDMGIITPARTIMQGDLGVDDSAGVWILTVYTLAYAASIPIMGKLADMFGRKYIYLTCIIFFGVGSLLCGLSQNVGSFEMLIASRCIQAIGGGGIMPIATAEVGTSFPPEKRGMALGLVGAVYGIASVFGASAGSLVLDIFGQHNWQFIFYINVPICIIVSVLGFVKLKNAKAEDVKPIDFLGIFVMTIMILSLMYFLKIVDFFDFANSIQDKGVYPFLIAFVALIPMFVLVERFAKDPVMNLSYFLNKDIVITLICSIISGIILMGVIFLPQFCENALHMVTGDGGYFIIILGIFCGVGSPMTGMLIDKFGVKPPLAVGFLAALLGSLFIAYVACAHPGLPTVIVSLALIGLGMGFTMGTPLNYMMLQKTDEAESNSALAMLSLVRSMGTAVAPAIMVAFIVHASSGMQDSLMDTMPKEVTVSPLPYAQELDDELEKMRSDDELKKMVKGIDIPKLTDYTTVEVNMDAEGSDFDVEISDEILDELQNSDVTTIVETCKHMATSIFAQVKPQLIEDAQGGVDSGVKTMKSKSKEMKDAIGEMKDGIQGMDDGLSELSNSISEMDGKISDAEDNISAMTAKLKEMDASIAKMDTGIQQMGSGLEALNGQITSMKASQGENAPAVIAMQKQADEMSAQLEKLKAGRKSLDTARSKVSKALAGITAGKKGMTAARSEMVTAKSEMQSSRAELVEGKQELEDARSSLNETITKLEAVSAAVPGFFDEAEEKYLEAIDDNADSIETIFQKTLNEGFKGMFLFVGICSGIALILLLLYKDDRKKEEGDLVVVEEDGSLALEEFPEEQL